MIQDKFIDGFIQDVIDIGGDSNNVFLLRGIQGQTKYIDTNNKIKYIGDCVVEIDKILKKTNKEDTIFIHWYDVAIADLVYKMPNKIVVFFWGGEFYEHPLLRNYKWLYDSCTKKYIDDNVLEHSKIKNYIIKEIYNYYHTKYIDYKVFLKRLKQIQRIDYLVLDEDAVEEVKFIRKLYPGSKFKHVYYCYDNNYDISVALDKAENSNNILNILVGNSSTPTSNHIDAFKLLSSIDANIYCTLSYGDIYYREHVIKTGQQIFGSRFFPITEYMSRKKYVNFINGMDVIYMFHNRSQAFGNIITAATLGKPIFLKKNNPITSFLKKLNIAVFDVYDINKYNLREMLKKESQNRLQNQKVLKLKYTKRQRLTNLSNLFTLINEHNN